MGGWKRWGIGVAVLLVAACAADAEEGGTLGQGTSQGPGVSTSTTDTGGEGTGSVTSETGEDEDTGSGGSSDTGVKFDLAEGGDVPQTQDGCQKIDFLFSIDTSSSMANEQDSLVAAFPDFISAIQQEVAGTDHHIMVIDSDANPLEAHCEDRAQCMSQNSSMLCYGESCCEGWTCGTTWDSLGLHACDETLGAGVRSPYGARASNMDCGLPDGRRYLTSEDADIAAKFSCIAQVGISGSSFEQPFTSMAESFTQVLTDPGGCNEGFLRDDAILVFTVITDDPPAGGDDSQGDASAWYQAIVDAKGGSADNIVVLGFIPMPGVDNTCLPGAGVTPPFQDFITMFGERGIAANPCDPMPPVFEQAVALIDQACDEYEPEG